VIEQRLIHDQRTAHAASLELYGIAKHRPGHYLLRLVELDPEWRRQLRGAFHGDVLRQIAEQAWVPEPDGTCQRWTKAAWKTLLKDWFLPEGFTSTEQLSDDELAEFVLQSCAFACVELGVEFEIRDAAALLPHNHQER